MSMPPLELAARAISQSASNSSPLAGRRIGSYPIVARLGAGGMGEVYRARDVRLGRDVAIKILSSPFSMDPERRARFEREARLLAALNHPNIAAIYGVVDVELSQDSDLGGVQALVLELVEGETLAERIARCPLSIAEATSIATQIAEALEAAHERGIIHRDLKPANIKIAPDGRVKVLDFGLAKSFRGDGERTESSQLSGAITEEGLIVGTAGYISPEQARGLPVDKRTDIWAFGCVLYEMLTGRQAFHGATMSDTIAAILEREPDLARLPAATPPSVRRLLVHCLRKNVKERLRDIGDLSIDLEESNSSGMEQAAGATRLNRRAWMAVSVALLMTSLALAGRLFFSRTADARVFRSAIMPPAALSGPAPDRLAISPDGRRLAFIAPDAGGRTVIWIRALDSLTTQPLADTDGASWQFWSPDSRFLAFVAGGKLKKVDPLGGPVVTLADAAIFGGTWNQDDVILFGSQSVIRRVPAAGGTPVAVTALDEKAGDVEHGLPFFLPDGRHFLYSVVNRNGGRAVYVGSLDSMDRTRLIEAGNAKFAQGYLLFVRESTLIAQPFDADRLTFTGDPTPQADQIATGTGVFGGGAYSVSNTGVLVYQTGPGWVQWPLVWFNRNGTQTGIIEPGAGGDLELSPDGTQAMVRVLDLNSDIWTINLANGSRTRFTFDTTHEGMPTWSRDGRIAFNRSVRAGGLPGGDLYVKPADGAGPEKVLLENSLEKFPMSWSPDGRFLLYGVVAGSPTSRDLWVLPLVGDRKAYPILNTRFDETFGKFSPDGRWLAFTSNESGRDDVYVMPFPGPGPKVLLSPAGGDLPRWRRDGTEVFYVAPDNKLMAASVNGRGSTFEVGAVQSLFQLHPAGFRYFYDTPDGHRFLVITQREQPASITPITLVVNWAAQLKRK